MTDPPAYTDTGDDTRVRPDRGSTTGTPRWVKILGTIVIVLVLLFAIMMFVGGGSHGPGQHTPSGGTGGQTQPSGVVTEDRTPPGDSRGDTPPTDQDAQPDGPGGHTPPVEHGP